MFFFGLSPAFAGKPAAEIEGFQITWEDVGQALERTQVDDPSEADRQKMLDALIARVLLAKEAQKKGLLQREDIQHHLALVRANVLAKIYLRENFSTENVHVTKEEVWKYYEKNKDTINPSLRSVIITDIYLERISGGKEDAQQVAEELVQALNNLGDKDPVKVVGEFRQKKGISAMAIAVPQGGKVYSNQEHYGGKEFTKELFSTPVGKAFRFRAGSVYKVVLVQEDLGLYYSSEGDALKVAERGLRAERASKSLEEEIEHLKKVYQVKKQ
jgi:hypothetical protein